jgi:hypothetical protein
MLAIIFLACRRTCRLGFTYDRTIRRAGFISAGSLFAACQNVGDKALTEARDKCKD